MSNVSDRSNASMTKLKGNRGKMSNVSGGVSTGMTKLKGSRGKVSSVKPRWPRLSSVRSPEKKWKRDLAEHDTEAAEALKCSAKRRQAQAELEAEKTRKQVEHKAKKEQEAFDARLLESLREAGISALSKAADCLEARSKSLCHTAFISISKMWGLHIL